MVKIYRPQEFRQHLLKPITGSYIPPVWLFLDTETTPERTAQGERHNYNIGWSYLWIKPKEGKRAYSRWKFHFTAASLTGYIEAMAGRYGNIMVCGHNLFFDLQACGFFADFTRWGWVLDFYYDRGLTYILKCSREGKHITCVSSTNWFTASLKSLGQIIGLEKIDIDFEDTDLESLKAYCKRDVEILARAVQHYIAFIQDHNLGRFSLTKASQGMTAFRTRFMDYKIYIHSDADVHALERSAYMGGRTECFFIGQCKGGPFVTLDINSMYPYVMKTFTYPTKLIEKTGPRKLWQVGNTIKSFCVIAECEIETKEPAYAVRHRGKTVFPVGQFTAFLSTRGLEYALKHDHIKRVVRTAVYRRAPLFERYVDYFYPLKLKYKDSGQGVMELLTKYYLNAFYGKFGQLEIITDAEIIEGMDQYSREEVFNMVTGRQVVITRLMNTEIVQYPGGEGENAAAAIAAHITEDARFTLWDVMTGIGRSRVLYTDTDSVKIRRRDLPRVIWPMSETALGALKVEDVSQRLEIWGAKNYRTEGGRKIKGIPRNAVEVRPGVFEYDSFLRQTTHLREGIITGAEVRRVSRSLKSPYTKGIVHPSGRVTPLVFPLHG